MIRQEKSCETKISNTLDVLIITTCFSEGTAAYRRIRFFIDYLSKNGINLKCISGTLLTSYRVLKQSRECLMYPVPLFSSKSPVASIINTLLSIPIIFYIVFFKPRVIFVSVPDYSMLTPSFIGARLVNAKFIVDIRDPPEVSYYTMLAREKRSKVLLKFVEFMIKIYYSVLHKSNVILAVTESLKRALEEKSLKNVMLIPNGADLATFKSRDKMMARSQLGLDNDTFVIVYSGMIGGYYDISKLLILIEKLNNISRRRILLLLAGPVVDKKLQELIKSPSLKDILAYLGELDVERLVTALSASDVGVIPRVGSPIFNYAVPAKFYEYVALGLPILAICDKNSELWRLVEENGLGFACMPEDLVCIERSLKALMSEEVYLKIKADVESFRHKVDRAVGAQMLLTILKQVLSKG